MHQVVARPAHHPGALGEHGHVADDLLEGEPRPDVADPGDPGDPMDAAVGQLDVAALVVGEDVHLVAAGAEELQHHFHGDGRAPRLEEGLWGQEENLHDRISSRVPISREIRQIDDGGGVLQSPYRPEPFRERIRLLDAVHVEPAAGRTGQGRYQDSFAAG